ncbi:hypothetical protein [Sinorhizobium meliloti]|uniref:hypothetical protein n=1 Tax=Rhizobium meliloti TaxID=382 RepID=UPI000FD8733D|nr:hypothetical protein [Sinorhizobium meliloti]RVG82566.1 hypothetical protein CN219_20470 [Sinorhizobium meliloti]RVI33521.1 hypothetical protein CN197_17470 [Sinorhizobium meliloti]RVI44641.1 hypothetical protein CN196_15025 [Sinorhizobium meliloti]RVJ25347.1 hypothetical protein CN177_13760 [Sinorhizobium meliloti]RVJ97646.1 hypothetical protein CN170_18245 [Sinorhizobium meliloti]
MKKFLVNAAVAAVIGLTGLVSTASAQSLTLELGPGGGVHYRDHDRHDDWRDRRHYDRRDRRGRCAPGPAVDKARDRGLRRAYVADVTGRRVVVEGRRHGHRQAIVFANARGCPIIGRW